ITSWDGGVSTDSAGTISIPGTEIGDWIVSDLLLVPLEDTVVFPGMTVTLAVDTADEAQVLLVPRHEQEYAKVGTVAQVDERVRARHLVRAACGAAGEGRRRRAARVRDRAAARAPRRAAGPAPDSRGRRGRSAEAAARVVPAPAAELDPEGARRGRRIGDRR